MTLARATLAVGVAALAADSFTHDTPVALLVTLAAVALALDAVDGSVARRTGTATALGARFDGEVDAFLILALSVYVAPRRAARGCSRSAPRATCSSPASGCCRGCARRCRARRWRRVVAATQGVVLTVAAAGVLPRALTQALLVAALAAARGVVRASARGGCGAAGDAGGRARRRLPSAARAGVALTVLALLLVWAAARRAGPARAASRLGAFARLPLELARRRRRGRPAARHAAPRARRGRGRGAERARAREGPRHRLLHGVRPAVQARRRLGLRRDRHRDAARRGRHGRARTSPSPARPCSSLALLAVPVLALLRVTRVAAGHRGRALRAAAALGVVWVVLRVAGAPVASSSAAAPGRRRGAGGAGRPGGSRGARPRDRPRPLPRHARRPAADRPAGQGRPARVRRELRAGRGPGLVVLARASTPCSTGAPRSCAPPASPRAAPSSPRRRSAASAGWRTPRCSRGSGSTASGATTSSSTSDRLTLTRAFKRAGWRTVGAMPANQRAWPEGSTFYRYDKVYDRRNLGYRGPELRPAADARPVHACWPCSASSSPGATGRRSSPRSTSSRATRRGRASPGSSPGTSVGDGSVFDRIPAQAVHGGRALRRRRPGPRRLRPVDRVLAEHALLVRAALRRRATSCSSCSATTSPRRSSPARARATTCRSRSSPTTRRCWTGSPAGAGRTACCRARRRRSGRWPRSATASSRAFGSR